MSDAVKEAEVNIERAINVFQWLKKCAAINNSSYVPILLGGAGNIVEIDESHFHHKPNIKAHFLRLHLIFIFFITASMCQ